MRIAQINSSLSGSPGMLMRVLSEAMDKKNIENRILISKGSNSENCIAYSSIQEVKFNALLSRLSGNYGFVSDHSSRRLIQLLDEFHPDLVQIHTVHGHDFNTETIFRYLKEQNIPIVYTFHDCWAFTGYCTHYADPACTAYQTVCSHCPVFHRYSWFIDHSRENFLRKKEALTGIENLTIVTPSAWMKDQVKTSFLKDRPCVVIPNGIRTDLFHPDSQDVRKRLNLEDRSIVLAMALTLSRAKGWEDLLQLADILPDHFQLVLVGVPEKARKLAGNKIICLPRTADQRELAALYSAADVFVNPTHEDNFPTVNLEALACGTPVVTYATGGSPEAIDSRTGASVLTGDISGLCREAVALAERKRQCTDDCRRRAVTQYDCSVFSEHYLSLYQKLLDQ